MGLLDRNAAAKTEFVFELLNLMYHAANRCGFDSQPKLALSVTNPSNEPVDRLSIGLNGSKFGISVYADSPAYVTFLTGTHRIDKDIADQLGIGEIFESRWPGWSGKYRLRRKLELDELFRASDPAERLFQFLKESLDLAVQIAQKTDA